MYFTHSNIKIWLVTILFFASHIVHSQNFDAIDAHAKAAPRSAEKTVESLATYLNEKTTTDLEKVRAYYMWITANIDYDTKTFFSANPKPRTSAADALKYKRAICQGYSELFKALCEQSKIPCFLLSGYSKGYGYNTKKDLTSADHAWNVVYLNDQWQLIDATWGSGYIDEKKNYVKMFFSEYFLTKPEQFILKHLPSDPMWQLLTCPISIIDYKKPDSEIIPKVEKCVGTFKFNDTIEAYLKLSPIDQQMASAERSFRFNPENYDLPGYALLNLSYDMSSELNVAYEKQDYAKALQLNKEILKISEEALVYLRKSKNPQATQAVEICKQNIESSKGNIKSLEKFMK